MDKTLVFIAKGLALLISVELVVVSFAFIMLW